MHFLILLCRASIHFWKDSSRMPFNTIVTGLLIASMPSNRVLLMIPLSLRKRKKVTLSKIRWIGRLFQYSNVFLSQELSDALSIVSRCIILVKQLWFSWPQLSSLLALNKAYVTRSPYKLADWLSGPVARTDCEWCPLTSKNVINMTLTVLLSSASAMLETSTACYDPWFLVWFYGISTITAKSYFYIYIRYDLKTHFLDVHS